MADNLNSIKITTPKGVASWPRLASPDTKFKSEGEYSVKLRLGGAEAAELVARLDAYHDEVVEHFAADIQELKRKESNPKKRAMIPERADPPYKELYEDDKPTGVFEFNFKMRASGVSKKTGKPWTRKPAVFDVAARPITDAVKLEAIGGGSIIRVSGEARPFHTAALGAGVSLALEAVQVLEVKSYGARGASDFGFGSEGTPEDEDGDTAGFSDESAGSTSAPSSEDF